MAAHFPSAPRNGFSAAIATADARRQLRLSIGVVAVLAVAIVSAAVSVGSHPLAARRGAASTAPVAAMQADAAGAKAS